MRVQRRATRNNSSERVFEVVRKTGLEPDSCHGAIELRNVELYYPARPQRRILNGMSLKVPEGKIAALVGFSGGGKSRYVLDGLA